MSLFSWLFGGPSLPPAPPPLFDPWDRDWELESFKCPSCNSWGRKLILNNTPMLECQASLLGQCRIVYFLPRYWKTAPTDDAVEGAGDKQAAPESTSVHPGPKAEGGSTPEGKDE